MKRDQKKTLKALVFWGLLAAIWSVAGWAFYEYIVLPTDWGAEPLRLKWEERDVEVLNPLMLGVVLLSPLLWIVRRYTLSDLPLVQQHLTAVVRALVIVALALGLSRVVFTTLESHVTAVFLVDTSASMPDEALADAQKMVQDAWANKGEKNDVKLVTFSKEAKAVEITPGSQTIPPIVRPSDEEELLTTNIQGAMRLAYGLFPQDHVKRIVLISDGNQTQGDLLGETYNARDYGIKVSARTFDYTPRPETLIRGFTFPDKLLVGAKYNLQTEVYSTKATKARFQLWQGIYKDGKAKVVDLEPGVNMVEFPTEVFEQGTTRYWAKMTLPKRACLGPVTSCASDADCIADVQTCGKAEAAEKGRCVESKFECTSDAECGTGRTCGAVDTFKPNNDYAEVIEVKGKPKVMYIEGERRKRSYLQGALSKTNIDIDARGPSGLPTKMKEFENFDAVIMSDVEARFVSNGKMRLIDQYVKGGGGFIMVGGENSFGPGGYYNTYMEKILPVTFDGEKKRDTPSLALMLVVDKSGSMQQQQRLSLVKEAAKAAVEILQRTDKVGVIAFDDGFQETVPLQSAANRRSIVNKLRRLQPSGGTRFTPALQQAFLTLEGTRAALKHIILLSDGEPTDKGEYNGVLDALRASRITISTVSVGREGRGRLREIARSGGGRHYATSDPSSIPKIFTKETSQVSRSQLVEEPFRPRLVKAVQAVRGINFSTAPYLLGYVSTRTKPSAETILMSRYKEPIYARWRRGLGKAAVFTSDVKNRWGVQWLKWEGYPKFWSQVVRDMMRVDNEETFPMELTIENGQGVIRVDAVAKNDAFINDLKPAAVVKEPLARDRTPPLEQAPERVVKPDKPKPKPKPKPEKPDEEEVETQEPVKPGQGRKTQKLTLQQTAPGRYEGRFDLTEYGSYIVEVDHKDEFEDVIATSKGSLTWSFPDEYLTLEPNAPLITKTAEIGGGGLNPPTAQLFDAEGESVKSKSELWHYFLFAALALMLLDLLLRRLRLYGKTAIPWERVAGRG